MDSFQSGEVQVGRSVELPCIASGFPNPTIRWLKDGRPLPADSRWTRRLTGLTISDLRMEDSGNYICEVTNSFGSKEVTGYLNVIGEGMNIGKVGTWEHLHGTVNIDLTLNKIRFRAILNQILLTEDALYSCVIHMQGQFSLL